MEYTESKVHRLITSNKYPYGTKKYLVKEGESCCGECKQCNHMTDKNFLWER